MAGSEALLRELGARVRARREERGLSRRELALRSGISSRYLAGLELGQQNISIARLAGVSAALEVKLSALLGEAEDAPAGGPGVIALLGLRGAGKTSIGRALARRLKLPFFELDQLVEQAAGMPLRSIFELHGERWFRALERETLGRFLVETPAAVLATGGGIVTEPETFELLLRRTRTVWLKAHPREHWDRVVAQGDLRPMANRARAMEELKALLAAREPLYSRAALTVATSIRPVEETVTALRRTLAAVARPRAGPL